MALHYPIKDTHLSPPTLEYRGCTTPLTQRGEYVVPFHPLKCIYYHNNMKQNCSSCTWGILISKFGISTLMLFLIDARGSSCNSESNQGGFRSSMNPHKLWLGRESCSSILLGKQPHSKNNSRYASGQKNLQALPYTTKTSVIKLC